MLPEISRSVVMPAPNSPLEIRNYPIPPLQSGSVLLRALVSEVCGTDVHLYHGRLSGAPYPIIPGHAAVGEIVEIGGELTDVDGALLQKGDAVTFFDVYGTCNACWFCLVGKASTRCPHRKVYGITMGADQKPGLSGGWSEYIYLLPGTKVMKLPSSVSPESWIGGGCGLLTAVHAIELANIRLGDRVLVQGSGPVGLSCAALALLSGAGWVGVIGAPMQRLSAAIKMGVDYTLDVTLFSREERRWRILDSTSGRGPDIVIEASGNPEAVVEGCELARDSGRYVIVGQYTDNGSVLLNPHLHINRKHLEILGCWGSDYSHLWRAKETLSRFESRINWASLISHKFTFENAFEALSTVESGKAVKAVLYPK